MNKDDKVEATELAKEHWEFLERWLRMIYIDAFIHGYKHAKEGTNDKS